MLIPDGKAALVHDDRSSGRCSRASAHRIKTSSNYQILDDQALDMVKRGKPLTPIPAALHGREFTMDIPVIFELQTG